MLDDKGLLGKVFGVVVVPVCWEEQGQRCRRKGHDTSVLCA